MLDRIPVSFEVWLLAGTGVVLLALAFLGKVPLGYNLRNLVVRWPIAVLTALTFTVVIFLLVFMLAFVTGMERLTEGTGQPGNVLVLADGTTDELFSNLGYNDTSNLERERATHDEEGQTLPHAVEVAQVERDGKPTYLCSREVYAVVNQPVPTKPGERPRRRFVSVRGIVDPEVAGLVHGLELFPGGAWFSEAGVQPLPGGQETAVQAVVGEGVSRELGRDMGKKKLEVGDLFELGDRKWVVVGILQSAGSTFDSEVWGKQKLVGSMFNKDNYTSIVVRTPDAESARVFSKYLTKNFKPAVQAQPEVEYYAKLSETNKQFMVAIIFVAVVMAVGGVFAVMNTMFAAINQRTKDIGVLRILGFTRWQILVSFFLESMAIALLGGLVGCALGLLVDGVTATSIVSGGQGGGGKFVVLKLVVDANTLAVGVLFTLAMGAIGGLLPSLAAMRLRPLESLR